MLEFAGRFSKPELLIKNFKYWAVVYKEQPSTLAQVAFILKREAPTFSEVLPEEMAEFPKVCAWYESKIKSTFGAVKFNYSAVMLKEQFVHFNVYPRYDKVITRYGMNFEDVGWPKKVVDVKIEIPEDVKLKIINDLKN